MKNKRIINSIVINVIFLFVITIFLTLGYSAFHDSLTISDSVSHVRVDKVVRINGVTTNSSSASNTDYASKDIISTVYIPAGGSITYNTTITNLGNVAVAVSNATVYSGSNVLSNVTTNISANNFIKICNNGNCTNGASLVVPITITNNGSSAIDSDIRVDLTFTEVYNISYKDTSLGDVLAGSNFTYNFVGNRPNRLSKVSGTCDNYDYNNGSLTITNVGSDISFTDAYVISLNGESIGTASLGENFTKTFTEWPITITADSGTYDDVTYNNHTLTITNVRSDVSLTGVYGTVAITNVSHVEGSDKNVLRSTAPVYNGMDVSFNVTFQRPEGSTETAFETVYDVEITNTNYKNYIFRGFDFHPNITASADSDTATLSLIPIGIENGDSIASGETKAFQVKLVLETNNPDGNYSTETSTTVDTTPTTPEDTGEITATITPNTGDLTGSNELAEFTLTATSTYSEERTFRLVSSNSNLELVDASGNPLGDLTIRGNTTKDYTVYVKAADGATFLANTAETAIYLNTSGSANTLVSYLNLSVDVYDKPDTTKVTVGNAELSYYYDKTDKVPKIKASWDRIDVGGTRVVNYVVNVYNTSGTRVATGETNSSTREYYFDNLSENTDYYFIVYGIDEAGNTGVDDASDATTNNGYATRSPNASFKWRYTVNTNNVNNLTVGGDGATAIRGASHTVTVTASGSSYGSAYTAPESVTVTMDGSSGSFYTYSRSGNNNTVGTIVIGEVTGNITIRADRAGGCLIEGTKILLANGTYKNIENIDYDDLLSVWNYDTGKITYTYPAFVEKEVYVDSYLKTTFDDGTTLSTYASHGVYSYDLNRYILTTDTDNYKVGAKIVKIEDGKIKIVTIKNIETITEDIYVYHIVSNGYFNVIANDVLTTDPNIMISNQYGFTKDIKWPEGTRDNIINNKNNLYTYDDFSDIMPYYMFKALRVDEGKYVVDQGMISFDLLKMYLASNPANSNYFKDLPMNSEGKRLITITTSLDKVNIYNKYNYLYPEGSLYLLPNYSNVKCYLNTTNNTCYKKGSKVRVDTSTHFIVIYN